MNLPSQFIDSISSLLGAETDAFLKALSENSPVSLRVNPAKFLEAPTGLFPDMTPVPWCGQGYYLTDRPAFTFDPLLHAGCYYVQEASSMFVEKAFRKALELVGDEAVCALDLCAAPGGKSTLVASLLPEDGVLVANELIRTRANILAENLQKWGRPEVVVSQSDPSAFSGLSQLFDVVLTDVPCSGEGMFRKDPSAVGEWSTSNVLQCALRQRSILESVWPALKPGGCLIYSTCTYNLSENEENVAWICNELGARLVEIPVDASWKISGAQGEYARLNGFPVYRFFPHKTKGEGFFLALLQKNEPEVGCEPVISSKRVSKEHAAKKSVIPTSVQSSIYDTNRFDWFEDRFAKITAFPKTGRTLLKVLEAKLRLVHTGIVAGVQKGKDVVPDASLALSVALNKDAVCTLNVSRKEAVQFLRREAMVLSEGTPLGWVLIQFESHPLGWIKNLGNRANNNYPNEWRIRSDNPIAE